MEVVFLKREAILSDGFLKFPAFMKGFRVTFILLRVHYIDQLHNCKQSQPKFTQGWHNHSISSSGGGALG
jgi:hypothetical protein